MGTLVHAYESTTTDARFAERKMKDANEALKNAEVAVERARRNGYSTLGQRTADREDAQTAYNAAVETYQTANAVAQEAAAALRRVRIARHETRKAEIAATFGGPDVLFRIGDPSLSGDWYGTIHYEIQLAKIGPDGAHVITEYVRDGVTHRYTEERFGFSVTVYGPKYGLRYSFAERAEVITSEPAKLNWSSLNGSLEDGETMLAQYQRAIALAHYLNERAQAWYEEDAAD